MNTRQNKDVKCFLGVAVRIIRVPSHEGGYLGIHELSVARLRCVGWHLPSLSILSASAVHA